MTDHTFGELDAHLMREGTHPRLYDKLGAHPAPGGTAFSVWAPNAEAVSVIGDFNGWRGGATPLQRLGDTGVWRAVVSNVGHGALYKYEIIGQRGAYRVAKADPYARRSEVAPGTASLVWHRDFTWTDDAWMARRKDCTGLRAPMSIYELHLGSWRRVPEQDNRSLTYREITPLLVDYIKRTGFTHVELMPLSEHPFYGSWGYQTTGYFAATSRYGDPEDLMALICALHRADIGVILDWVPAHFPTDEHGLVYFDGTPLYEYADPRRGFHPEWNTQIFDYGRQEVRSFLLSSAMAWIERFHVDGLRVDGVASMLYRDYGRSAGEWIPNEDGSNQNYEAVELLRRVNDAIHREHPDVVTMAEESTAWPQVTGRTGDGALGFDFKWDMGWMHDTLSYLARDPIHRRFHHGELTMRGLYAFSEAFALPLSHDEVVYGKHSLLRKMPGDRWQQFANLRLLYAYMYSQPGKKLMFMGSEFAQLAEWNHDASLDWHLLDEPAHRQVHLLVGELNRVYRSEPALHDFDCDPRGFRWLVVDDKERSVMAYERIADDGSVVIVALNFTPVPRHDQRLGVPAAGVWEEIFNSDSADFGGSGHGNLGGVEAAPVRADGREQSIKLVLPPLAAVFLRLRRETTER
jgi:1,4-alpha-glucan branching enzyme